MPGRVIRLIAHMLGQLRLQSRLQHPLGQPANRPPGPTRLAPSARALASSSAARSPVAIFPANARPGADSITGANSHHSPFRSLPLLLAGLPPGMLGW